MKKILLISIIFIYGSFAKGESLTEILVNCNEGSECNIIRKKMSHLKGQKFTLDEIVERLKFIALDNSIKSYKFKVIQNKSGNFSIQSSFDLISKTSKILINVDKEIGVGSIKNLIRFKEKDYIHEGMIQEAEGSIRKHLRNRGYSEVKINHRNEVVEGKKILHIDIVIKNFIKIRKVVLTSDNNKIKHIYGNKLEQLPGKLFDRLKTKVILSEIARNLLNDGYYLSSVSLKKIEQVSPNEVDLKMHINFGEKYNFSFRNNKVFSRFDLLEFLKISITEGGGISGDAVKSLLKKEYEKIGLYNTKVSVRIKNAESKIGVQVKNFYVDIREGEKIRLDKLVFQGNVRMSLEDIRSLYYRKASVLGGRGFLDKKYLASFSNTLKAEYLKRGFVLANVSDVRISTDTKGIYSALFNIREGNQYILDKINITGVSSDLANKIRTAISNKEGKPINPLAIDNDLNKGLEIVRDEGFCFASISNRKGASVVSYGKEKSFAAEVDIIFSTGKKCIFNAALVVGHATTKTEVITREIKLKQKDIVTPKKLNAIRDRIIGLGLFSNIKVTPYIAGSDSMGDTSSINLLVHVKEKAFGLAEFAPGYRTDIGIKFSTLISYNNLWEKNHSLSSKLQVNQRLDYSNLDARRKEERKNKLEGLVRMRYIWPYFLNTINLSTTLSFRRRRFYSFDADILRVSPTLSKQFKNYLSSSVTYQFEKIRQFDASDTKDEDQFRIGGITPSVTFDFRDNPVRPTKGSFFRLSWEFANPTFSFGTSNPNNEINFSKLISRNKFYYPYKGWVFAVSYAFGAQWNNAKDIKRDATSGAPIVNSDGSLRTVGYIPSIKVFRLDGFDVVRGFSDEEINKTLSGTNISELRVQDKAFFTNIKLEPRYYWSDYLATGVFLDAGRIFVNKYKPLKLRKSVGLSLKFLTAVGTLDFNYGIKVKRHAIGSNAREKFGRFNLSIGYF